MLKLTHQASLKSYLVIIIPKAYEVLTTNNIRSSWGQFNKFLKIIHLASRKVTMDPSSYEKLAQSEIRSNWSPF